MNLKQLKPTYIMKQTRHKRLLLTSHFLLLISFLFLISSHFLLLIAYLLRPRRDE